MTGNPERRARRRSPGTAARGCLGGLLTGGLLALLGCGSDSATPAPLSPSQLYWALQLNEHAVLLALDTTCHCTTVQLTATPLNALGVPLPEAHPVTFATRDTSVTVSPTGLVTARAATPVGQLATVIASLQDPAQGITYADSVKILVTATPAPLTRFSLQPAAGDSAKRNLDAVDYQHYTKGFPWPVTAEAGAGDTVCSAQGCAIPVYYTSSAPLVATIGTGAPDLTWQASEVTPQAPGHVWFMARTLAYGHAWADSVDFTIGYLLRLGVSVDVHNVTGVRSTVVSDVQPAMVVGVGAVVLFRYTGADTTAATDIAFSRPGADTAACDLGWSVFPATGSGNIDSLGVGTTLSDGTHAVNDYSNPINYACRRFTTPGDYKYYSTKFPSDTFLLSVRSNPP